MQWKTVIVFWKLHNCVFFFTCVQYCFTCCYLHMKTRRLWQSICRLEIVCLFEILTVICVWVGLKPLYLFRFLFLMFVARVLLFSEITAEGRRITKLDQILLNGNNIAIVSCSLLCLTLCQTWRDWWTNNFFIWVVPICFFWNITHLNAACPGWLSRIWMIVSTMVH